MHKEIEITKNKKRYVFNYPDGSFKISNREIFRYSCIEFFLSSAEVTFQLKVVVWTKEKVHVNIDTVKLSMPLL